MRDELFDRSYAAGRAELNAGIDRALKKIIRGASVSFAALHRLEWSAPWKHEQKRA
jgi:hypothetical protein